MNEYELEELDEDARQRRLYRAAESVAKETLAEKAEIDRRLQEGGTDARYALENALAATMGAAKVRGAFDAKEAPVVKVLAAEILIEYEKKRLMELESEKLRDAWLEPAKEAREAREKRHTEAMEQHRRLHPADFL